MKSDCIIFCRGVDVGFNNIHVNNVIPKLYVLFDDTIIACLAFTKMRLGPPFGCIYRLE